MVKKNKSKREISNRLLYTLISIGILAILAVGVYAVPGAIPNPGHSITQLQPCSNGEILKTSGGVWTCGNDSVGGGVSSQWTTLGNDIYYNNGTVGIGTVPPLLVRLNVSGGIASNSITTRALSTSLTAIDAEISGGTFTATIFGRNGLLVNPSGNFPVPSNPSGVRGESKGIGVLGGGNVYDFYAFGNGTNYGAPSSIRWKKNIKPINNALDIISNIDGVYFDWNKDYGGGHDVGFIGEQIGQYIPEIVQFDLTSSKPNYYVTGIDYSKITPVLLEAIKEQQRQIDSLKLEVEQLKNK